MRTWLLGNAIGLADTGEFFHSVRDELMHGASPRATLALLLVFAALVGLIMLLSRMFRAPDSIAPPPRSDLMPEAAELLALSAGERRDVALLAHRSGTSQPVAMLLSPANLSFALSAANSNQPDARLASHIQSLCIKLHGTPLPGKAAG